MKKILVVLLFVCFGLTNVLAVEDELNPLITAMPSLTISPDGRASGLGDIGVATSTDQNSQHWNAAKYAFINSKGGVSVNYSPWLRKLVKDINLAYIAGYYKFDDLQAISASFTYFSLGEVNLTDYSGQDLGHSKPNEFAFDVAYSRKLHDFISMSATLRFMYSDLNNGSNLSTSDASTEMKAAWTMAADIGFYYRQPLEIKSGTSLLSVGLTLNNLGGKMSYDDITKQFIPASIRLGLGYKIPFNRYNSLGVYADVGKLMVPSRNSKYAKDDDGNELTGQELNEWYSALSSVKGIFYSFADAPGGFKEEMQELQPGIGLEYSYNQQFFGRLGYSYENYYKGNRNYFTLGAGFHLSIFSLDVSYCIATVSTNPLDQTLRFTLGFDVAGIKDLVSNKR